MTERVLHLSHDHAGKILHAAAMRYPAECCGLLEGSAASDGWQIRAVHETANLAADPQRHFLIDPQRQIELFRWLRGSAQTIIGCFHSHPGGSAEPSDTDLAQAIESEFLWIIASGKPDAFVLNAYVFTGAAFERLRLVQGE